MLLDRFNLKFLGQTEEEDTDDLVKDRKIQDFVDKACLSGKF